MKYTQDEDQILDIMNDGFLKVFEHIDQFKGKGTLYGWVRTIVFRSLSDYFRKSRRDFSFLIYPGDYPTHPLNNPGHGLFYDDLIQLLDRLNEKERLIFHKVCIEGYAYREIADEIKLTESTCRWYLTKARKKLKAMIQKTAAQ